MSAGGSLRKSSEAGVAEAIAALQAVIAPIGALHASADTSAEALPQRMGIRIGALHLLIPSDGGREVMPPPPISRIPNTVSWLRGLANVRGNLVPVVDLTAALVMKASSGARPYLLISGQGDAAMGILIDALPRLVNLTDADRPVERPPLPALLQDAVTAAYERDGGVWFDMDLNVAFDTLARHIAL